MKKIIPSLLVILFAVGCLSMSKAQTLTKSLPAFEKVIVSPLINLVLEQGEQESIRLEYEGVAEDKINYNVEGKTLKLYLDGAKLRVKNQRYDKDGWTYNKADYENVHITAYVTYRKLEVLQVRGEETTICKSALIQPAFKLKVFGESKVTLIALETNRLKVSLYGQNQIKIQSGSSDHQRYWVYGENKIDSEKLVGKKTTTTSFGESTLYVHASQQLLVTALGESDIVHRGGAQVSRKIVLGSNTIRGIE
ncbi:DUF2807 domain-containing protein [Rhodocytophaga rosea]|uniref:DUF2807 domain-containing protein n=1 Tax=Rhodocytophaga rosea TaxID=2704465 RepID=A0A6C0GSW7_9BACT|nr:DUF2807 domain-containing protein [Rhodocytophaga rosea]QHT70643.1 DUF2807 domain-containing protein [Rhodocytophaga rosea]